MTGAPLSPSLGFYALIAVAVIYGLGWIIVRARARVGDDPVADEFEREEWRSGRPARHDSSEG